MANVAAAAASPEVLRKIRQVEIRSRILADEQFLGRYRSVFRGWGLEFEEVREYEFGDDIRSIDWNVTARLGTPYIKKFREERELTVILAVDVSASAWFGTAQVSKRELAADVAALLGLAALRSNDRVGLLLFSEGVDLFVRPSKGKDQQLRIIRELLFAVPRRSRTNIAAAMQFLRNVLKRRGVVFVISDFFDTGYEAALRGVGQRHDVVAITLNDPREFELPSVGVVAVEDAESGAVRYVDTGSRRVRDMFRANGLRRREERSRAFGRLGIDRVDLWTDRSCVPPLLTLFRTRARRL